MLRARAKNYCVHIHINFTSQRSRVLEVTSCEHAPSRWLNGAWLKINRHFSDVNHAIASPLLWPQSINQEVVVSIQNATDENCAIIRTLNLRFLTQKYSDGLNLLRRWFSHTTSVESRVRYRYMKSHFDTFCNKISGCALLSSHVCAKLLLTRLHAISN